MKSERSEADDWRDRVPFLIRRRQFKDGPWPAPSVFHEQGSGQTPPHGWADRVLADGRGMLLIDGLDELRPERRKAAIEWIKELADSLPPETIFAVTSRPQALPSEVLASAGFHEFAVRDLSPSAQKTFVNQWHEAVGLHFPNQTEKLEKLEQKRLKLLDTLERERAISVLARNPLLCALICALNRVYQTDLPKNLWDLCDSACKMLLWDRDVLADVRSKDFLPKYGDLTYTQRLQLARSLAYDVAVAQADTITRKAALDIIQTEMHLRDSGGQEIADEVLKGIVERSNLLRDVGDDEYEFVHNTLRDFLASSTLVRRDEKSLLLKGLRGGEFARWEPVVCFCAASKSDPQFGIDLLARLLKPARAGGKISPRQEVFALKLVGHLSGFMPPEIQAQLLEIEGRFLPVDSPEKVKKLATAGEAAVEHFQYRHGIEEEIAAAMVEALGRIETPLAKEVVETWLTSDHRPKVLDSLAQAVGYEALSKHINLLRVPRVFREATSAVVGSDNWAPYVNDLGPFRESPTITELYLDGTKVVDLAPLTALSSLEALGIGNTDGINFGQLTELTQLEYLHLNGTQISDLQPLMGLKKLRILSLEETQVSDLSPLDDLRNLSVLYISRGQISGDLLKAFVERHPVCAIREIDQFGETAWDNIPLKP